jgi:hypothetical protein
MNFSLMAMGLIMAVRRISRGMFFWIVVIVIESLQGQPYMIAGTLLRNPAQTSSSSFRR